VATFKFTSAYQDLALAVLIRHQAELGHLVPCLKASYFGSVESTLAAEAALTYFNRTGRFPTFTVLAQLVATAEAKLAGDREQGGVAYVERLEELDTSDWEHVGATLVEFAREAAIVGQVRKAIDLLKEGKEPPEGWSGLFDEAMQVGQNLDDLGLVLHADAAKVVDKVTSEEYGISTGYPLLDQIWKLGWKPGWLVVPLAPPKFWKTDLCLNLALNMASVGLGYDVLYYACEINQELAMMRVLCHVGNMDLDLAYESPEAFKDTVGKALQKRIAGNFVFKSFASKSATIADIRAHAKRVIKQLGLHVKAIFIDYAETVRPAPREGVKGGESDWRQQASIYTDARALAGELGCVVVMPDRCNRETVGRAVPNMKSFQGAFEKAGIVDVALGICATEEERLAHKLRLFVFLNRHGAAFQHLRGRVDPTHHKIEWDEFIPYEPDEDDDGGGRRKRRPRDPNGPSPRVPSELLRDDR
jgi:DnaB-like helicase C terminal domain